MLDFISVYQRFEDIRRVLAQVEHSLMNHNGKMSALEHSQTLKLLQMAESESQTLLVIILRLRGGQTTVRRHGQDSAVSFTAGLEPSTGLVTLTTTDVFANQTESYVMPQEQFVRLVQYLELVAAHCSAPQVVAPPPDSQERIE